MYVPLPPEGVSFAENGTPTSHSVAAGDVASGIAAATTRGWRTTISRLFVSDRPSTSAALYVARNAPSVVGEPDSVPVAGSSERPGGTVPDATDHVTGLEGGAVESAPDFMTAVSASE